jgi:dTDP-4-amino-4,6-dideoxygalactose transaminase
MADQPVPFVDLAWQAAQIADEVDAGFAAVIARTAFIDGPDVAAFETEFAAACEVPHAIGVANGTDAIELALRALDIGPGHEVILPANTFIATAEAVVRAGATPVLVDCDADSHLIDTDAVAGALTERTRAVVPVHLYGQIAPMERISSALADRPDVVVVEDAAQSQGARRNGRPMGGWGVAAATSFDPGKNLGAYGDAGAVLTTDTAVADRVRLLRAHGSPAKYVHEVVGWNSRLDTLQAVVLRAKLRRLEEWNELRRAAAERYAELLGDVDEVALPTTLDGNEHVWHLYVVRIANRDAVADHLRDAGVASGIHYPTPIHLTAAFASLGYGAGAFPVSEAVTGQILSLPMFPGITAEQQERVAEALRKALVS